MEIKNYTTYSSLNKMQQQVVDVLSETSVLYDLNSEEGDWVHSVLYVSRIEDYIQNTSHLMSPEVRSQFTVVLEELNAAKINFINL